MILIGQRLKIYTDHKNLTCKFFNAVRLLRWRLILEDYGPESVRGCWAEGVGDIQVDGALLRERRCGAVVTERCYDNERPLMGGGAAEWRRE